MLHVTTEIGKPGKCERQKRHFPQFLNRPSVQKYQPSGRRFIPHGRGQEYEFIPHPHSVQPKYSDNGPDWKSRARYIPSPRSSETMAQVLVSKPWKPTLRPFPDGTTEEMSRRTDEEWLLYPESKDTTLRCHWDGQHKATVTSTNEITETQRFGKIRTVLDKRNGIPFATPGDKNYAVTDCSPDFCKLGTTLPVVNFGCYRQTEADTFVPLQGIPSKSGTTWVSRMESERRAEEEETVRALETWRPATPLIPPPSHLLHPPAQTDSTVRAAN